MKIIYLILVMLFLNSCTTTKKTKVPLSTSVRFNSDGTSTVETSYIDTVTVVRLNSLGERIDTIQSK